MVNTFVLDDDYSKSASLLDRARLGKQRVEAVQILRACRDIAIVSEKYNYEPPIPFNQKTELEDFIKRAEWAKKIREKYLKEDTKLVDCEGEIKKIQKSETIPGRQITLGWSQHAIIRMWIGYENSLEDYINAHMKEWENRGYKNSKLTYFKCENCPKPWWVTSKVVQYSHQASLLRKEQTRNEKKWYDFKVDSFFLNTGYIWTGNLNLEQIKNLINGKYELDYFAEISSDQKPRKTQEKLRKKGRIHKYEYTGSYKLDNEGFVVVEFI